MSPPRPSAAKLRQRLSLIAAHSAHNLLLPIINTSVSLLVIRFASSSLWGEFVFVLILVNFAAHILRWGNRDYLLREFSLKPAAMTTLWQTSLLSRLPVWILFIPIAVLLNLSPDVKIVLMLWVLLALVYQSFDVVVIFKQKFKLALFLEFVSLLLLIAAIIIFRHTLSLNLLVFLFATQVLLKMLVLAYCFRKDLLREMRGRFEIAFFREALPFFMLGFSGMLISRIDLYSVAYFLSDDQVGQYQVLINLLLYLQSIASFIIAPFIKYLYRLPTAAIKKATLLLAATGIVLNVPATAALYFILSYYYHFIFSADIFVLSYFFVAAGYFYVIKVQELFRNYKQNVVVYLCFFYTIINLLLNIFLIPLWEIKGALVATTAVQWMLTLSYFASVKRLRRNQ